MMCPLVMLQDIPNGAILSEGISLGQHFVHREYRALLKHTVDWNATKVFFNGQIPVMHLAHEIQEKVLQKTCALT